MRRRDFIAGLLATSAPNTTRAQTRPLVSILHSGFPHRTPIHYLTDALSRLGYENGRSATIEVLGGEGDPDRLSALVVRLAAEKPDVVIAITSPAVLALKQARLSLPVAFAFVADPVGMGLIDSVAHPGGNFTGIAYSEVVLGGKRLELLLEAVPAARRIAVLWSRGLPENAAPLDSIGRAAAARAVDVVAREVKGLDDLAPAFDDAARAGAQAVIFMTDNLMFGHRRQVADLALARRLPSAHSFRLEAEDGGLMYYGPHSGDAYERVAALAARILKGARPADLPVEQPTRFELVLNLKTAKALGLAVPPSLLAGADEVIE